MRYKNNTERHWVHEGRIEKYMQGSAKESTLAENRTGADGCRSEPGLYSRTEEDIDLLPRLSSNHPRTEP